MTEAIKDLAKGVFSVLVLHILNARSGKALDDRVREIVVGENAELYSHLLAVEQCVTLLGERINRMQEGLRVLGDDKAVTGQAPTDKS